MSDRMCTTRQRPAFCTDEMTALAEPDFPRWTPPMAIAADGTEFLLADMAAQHLYTRDGQWLPLVRLGVRHRWGALYVDEEAYEEMKGELLRFGSFAAAEGARRALVTTGSNSCIIQILPGDRLRCLVVMRTAT